MCFFISSFKLLCETSALLLILSQTCCSCFGFPMNTRRLPVTPEYLLSQHVDPVRVIFFCFFICSPHAGLCPKPIKNRDVVTLRSWRVKDDEYIIINFSVKHPVRFLHFIIYQPFWHFGCTYKLIHVSNVCFNCSNIFSHFLCIFLWLVCRNIHHKAILWEQCPSLLVISSSPQDQRVVLLFTFHKLTRKVRVYMNKPWKTLHNHLLKMYF